MTTGEQAAAASAAAVTGLGSGFMQDPATYVVGMEKGFAGIDFYFAGRAGVLGETSADVVTAALVFFKDETVRTNWDASAGVMPRAEAVSLWADCAERWADAHLADSVDWARLAELAGKVAANATVAGAPIFAGWRSVPVPTDPKAAALHQMNVLRELRMARHAAAVVGLGLDVGDAVRHRSPQMLFVFGWEDQPLDPGFAARWDEAEALTDKATALDYAVLTPEETEDFVRLAGEALAAVG